MTKIILIVALLQTSMSYAQSPWTGKWSNHESDATDYETDFQKCSLHFSLSLLAPNGKPSAIRIDRLEAVCSDPKSFKVTIAPMEFAWSSSGRLDYQGREAGRIIGDSKNGLIDLAYRESNGEITTLRGLIKNELLLLEWHRVSPNGLSFEATSGPRGLAREISKADANEIERD